MKKLFALFIAGLIISASSFAAINPNQIQSYNTVFTGTNVVVNGDARIAQINGPTLVTGVVTGSCTATSCTGAGFTVDGSMYSASSAGTLNQQQVTTLSSLGAPTALETISTSAHTIAATDYASQGWAIEGLNFARFGYGAAGAQAGSLQFMAACSVTGTYAGSIQNYARTRSYTFSYSCSSATPAIHYIQNIPGDTGGTWVTTNNGAAIVSFDIGSGSNFQTAAGAWTTGDFRSVSGATGLLATNGATLTITDVQFEVGAFSTQFERKLYGQVLAEAQRYLPVIQVSAGSLVGNGFATTSSVPIATITLPVTARVPPTGFVATNGWAAWAYTNTQTTVTNVANLNSAGINMVSVNLTTAAVLTAGQAGYLYASTTGYIAFTGSQL